MNYKILTGHFTGKEKIITLSLVILMLSLINITLCFSNNYSSSVSALSYQSRTGVSFTFEPTLSISLSSSDLVISNLVPGSSSDSNSINVSVATNAAYGYTLLANTNNESLIHNNNINTFSSIPSSANLESLTTDNTWGYSTSLDNGSSWSNYNGLSSSTSNTTNTLVDTNHQIEDTIGFKIGARAGSNQPSGVYTSIINFTAVAKPTPETITDLEYLQDFAYISPTDLASVKNSMPMNSTFTLKDQRDEQEYTIAKLSDNKIWITKNLNLAGGTEITAKLSDVPENYTLPTANGFLEGNRLPESSASGFNRNIMAFIYNSNNETNNCSGLGCYSYYSWIAATAGSGVNLTTDGDNAPYSICPKGWRLPTSGSDNNSDFSNLIEAYQNFYDTAGPGTTPNFQLGGYIYYDNFRDTGGQGWYWSSTSAGTYTYQLFFYNGNTLPNQGYLRQGGLSLRCLAR